MHRGVPVVFALTRMGLGSIFGTNKRMSGERCSCLPLWALPSGAACTITREPCALLMRRPPSPPEPTQPTQPWR